jgi:hypothetical protein
MYSYYSSSFLLTQKQWKIFVENTESYTFFGGNLTNTPYVRSTHMCTMGPDFLKAIVICLLSKRNQETLGQQSSPMGQSIQTPHAQSVSTLSEASSERIHGKEFSQEINEMETMREAAFESRVPIPNFISGLQEDGTPIYCIVIVLSPDHVASIEEDIEKEARLISSGETVMEPLSRMYFQK